MLTGESSPIPRGLPRWKKFDGNIITGGTVLNQDFKEFIQLLSNNGVRFHTIASDPITSHALARGS